MTHLSRHFPIANAPLRRRCASLWLALCAGLAAAPVAWAEAPKPAATVASAAAAPAAPATPAPSLPEVAAPQRAAAEAEFIARMDALIAPLRGLAISVDDAKRVREAISQATTASAAAAIRDQISDPVGRKLVDWAMYRRGGTPQQIKAFLDANLDWPSRDQLLLRAEEQLLASGAGAAQITALYGTQPARSGIGLALQAIAALERGEEARAKTLAAEAWRRHDLGAANEQRVIERLGKLLTPADHKWRLDRLLVDDSRWEDERSERAAFAKRVIPLLPEADRPKANARVSIFLRSAGAAKAVAALPADAHTKDKPDWGLAFQLAQHHRRAGRLQAAAEILLTAPTDAALLVSPDDWWDERRRAAFDALKAGNADLAYRLVRVAGPLSVNPLKEATFMAGWIALKNKNDAKAAEEHFRAFTRAADGPLSRGSSNFWLARALEAQGRKDDARAALQAAARNTDTFHGLLARQILEPGRTEIRIPLPALPSAEEAEKFNAREVVKAAVIARKSGLDPSIGRIFLTHLRNTMSSETEAALLSHLAEALGDTQMSVRIAKSAIARGMNLIVYGYPVHPMPAYTPLRTPPEPALMLAIARQESEFNPQTVSGAGARGLLQVMPITARHVCKDYKMRCDIARLMSDPAYNAKVSSAYIADRMDEFGGSYVMSIAGYNAGPSRARTWARDFGDPRDPKTDPVDWIHRIPFDETREYVQKVMSNLQIYRARLGNGAKALQLSADLRRSAPGRATAATAGND